MLDRVFSQKSDELKEIVTPVLKIRGKALVFENSIYSIFNISPLELVDLSDKRHRLLYFIVLLVIDIICLFLPSYYQGVFKAFMLLGILVLIFTGGIFYEWQRNQRTT